MRQETGFENVGKPGFRARRDTSKRAHSGVVLNEDPVGPWEPGYKTAAPYSRVWEKSTSSPLLALRSFELSASSLVLRSL